ncbi:polymer-forming cytoskeletal protein [Caenibacillus caldisaponilyticus]|uniref:polymer-forming cytoskeletal protein n=1 Tax=Caenibacillus caldisaponilyticus TaxID=1674942 RepID=UPI0009885415|nr:polymer-forming cytoskeletal protein [Caenibacillus caldisaponilyticus]
MKKFHYKWSKPDHQAIRRAMSRPSFRWRGRSRGASGIFQPESAQKGFTLVPVLAVCTLFILLGLSIAAIGANSAIQNGIRESRVQATDLAEMGLKAVSGRIDDIRASSETEAFDKLNALAAAYQAHPEVTVEPGYSYRIAIERKKLADDTEEWTITSQGVVRGKPQAAVKMVKTFAYKGSIPETPPHNGLSLPYLPVALHAGGGVDVISGLQVNGDIQTMSFGHKNGNHKEVNVTGTLYYTDRFDCNKCEIGRAVKVDAFPHPVDFDEIKARFMKQSYRTILSGMSAGSAEYPDDVKFANGYAVRDGDRLTFKGNVFVNGDLKLDGEVEFQGYVYVDGDLVIDHPTAVFDRTVYVAGDVDFPNNNSQAFETDFKRGLVVAGTANIGAKNKGQVTLSTQEADPNSSESAGRFENVKAPVVVYENGEGK